MTNKTNTSRRDDRSVKVKLTAWEIKVNDKGVEMAVVNREALVNLLKYVEQLEAIIDEQRVQVDKQKINQ